MQEIRSSNPPVVTGICDPNKSRVRNHRSLKLASKISISMLAFTGSKNVVTLMDRCGHCASSETIRRIDMSLEATINDKEKVVPDGIRKLPFLSTGTAWDNFGINLETHSGKDTIHHNYGICYQKYIVGDLDTQAEVPLEKKKSKETVFKSF